MTIKTMSHASADFGFIFKAYNLRRLFNLIPQKALKTYLEQLFQFFWAKFELKNNISLNF